MLHCMHPVPVTRDIACRARESKERFGQKMEQGMLDEENPQKKNQQLQVCARQTNYRAGQSGQFRTSQHLWAMISTG